MAMLLAALSLVATTQTCNVDMRQAEACLQVIAGKDSADEFLQLHGTRLIVAQQNVSRTVTPAQYAEAVRAGLGGTTPRLAVSADATARERRGVEGLLRDVAPSIEWATKNKDVLAQRLERLRTMNLCAEARRRAERAMPARSEAQPNLYVVMGGRAGAAAIDNDIYFDVLASSFKGAYPSDEEIVDYFAHEMHHVLYGSLLHANRMKLRPLTEGEQATYDLLESLLMEGSATYFVNLHRDATRIERDDAILAAVDDVLTHPTDDHEPFTGNALHTAGAMMLAEIDRVLGYAAVRRVMLHPHLLLVTYNRAVAGCRARGGYRFPDATAEAATKIGTFP